MDSDRNSDIGTPVDNAAREAVDMCHDFTNQFQGRYSADWPSTIAAWWRVHIWSLSVHDACLYHYCNLVCTPIQASAELFTSVLFCFKIPPKDGSFIAPWQLYNLRLQDKVLGEFG